MGRSSTRKRSSPTTSEQTELLRFLTPQERAEIDRLIAASPRPYSDWFTERLPGGWSVPAHVKLILDALDAVDRGEIDRLAISMPPRHGKSETITARYPVYCLSRWPKRNVLVTGYSAKFVRTFGRRARNLAEELGLVVDDAKAADQWATTSGGFYLGRGVGAPPTGTGFHRIIVDDPIKSREQAESLVYRDKAYDWYSQDLYTRLEPQGAIVMVATRWHHDDVIARAIASEPDRWTVINLPALDADGEALWPERYDVDALERIRAVNPRSFEALYQGNPTPMEGDLFNVSRLAVSDDLPKIISRVRRWDIAASKGKNDYTAGVLLGKAEDGRCVVLDVQRFQLAPDERNQRIRQVAEMDGLAVKIIGPQDPGSAGVEAAQAFTRLLAGFSVSTVRETGDKATRADPFAASVGAGNVILQRADWNASFIEELRQFPGGAHDDQVDAAAGAFIHLFNPKGLDYDAFLDW